MLGQRISQSKSAPPAVPGAVRRPALAYGLLAVTVAINAVLFPLWTGFPGGAKPLANPAGALPHLILAALNAIALLVMAGRMPARPAWRMAMLLFFATLTRAAYLATRSAQGADVVDPDIALYFRYAQSFAGGSYPAMEYPQGALLLFTAAFRLASADAGRFGVILPLFSLVFDLVAIASLVGLGERFRRHNAAWAVCLFYAISPLTLVLWYGKFDAVPAGLLALGTYLFAERRYHLSAVALAAGFLVKWLPGIAIAFFAVHLFRVGRWPTALGFLAVAALAVFLPVAGFWRLSPEHVLYTYSFHETRPLMGESLLYLPVYFLQPAARLDSGTRPWSDVDGATLDNRLATMLQLGGTALALLACGLTRRKASAIALAAIGVAAFILLNRVFSPQYSLVLLVAYMASLAVLPAARHIERLAPAGLLAITLLNYYVWPLWTPFWLAASALFFALNLATTAFLAVRCFASREARTCSTIVR